MELIFRTAGIYLFLLILFRVLGKRSLSELSAFDFILFLIISEAVQNALVDEDKSVVMGLTVILTFLMLDLGLSVLKARYGVFEKIAEGVPLVLVDRGEILQENMKRARVTYSDILQTARESQGLERLSQIKYAVLETSGAISIIPADGAEGETIGARLDALEEKLDRVLARARRSDGDRS
ncbi:DUF421 domain-containing protein [Noviherbaspirillum aridicola]|uniref:DUF421 domain-containing protein n=1 Tax=Noviherbaspirillum aridicola TaxID=2849687 RepID=A0ABQ4QAC2_9BURK|nr:YetF domain-containing protein [Noviherbaspirillum aridicola]GIZ53931.1 DUF421 domain-containing protein [Noviherbaspirillum aridicola]